MKTAEYQFSAQKSNVPSSEVFTVRAVLDAVPANGKRPLFYQVVYCADIIDCVRLVGSSIEIIVQHEKCVLS